MLPVVIGLRNAIAGVLFSILFIASANAQSPGMPTLPAVPRTGKLHNIDLSQPFRFIVAGDNRPASASSPQPRTLTRIFRDARRRFRPAFFLWSGDIIYGHSLDGGVLEKQYKEFFRIAGLGRAPVFNAPGNHEMDLIEKAAGEAIEAPSAQLQAFYLKFMEFAAGAPPYGAFNFGNSRFMAVDTEEVVPADATRSEGPTVGSGAKLDPGFVGPGQFELLKAALDANKDKAHIFVFMHHPIKPMKNKFGLNTANAQQLEQLFGQYPNVSYVIAAHEHLLYNPGRKSLEFPERKDPSELGPFYVVSGGAGAPLDSCKGQAGNCGEFNHYLVFDVNGNKVKARVVRLNSSKSLPRSDSARLRKPPV